jgi:hypothetical protein
VLVCVRADSSLGLSVRVRAGTWRAHA